jgi:hypothetical protein
MKTKIKKPSIPKPKQKPMNEIVDYYIGKVIITINEFTDIVKYSLLSTLNNPSGIITLKLLGVAVNC